MSLPLHESRVLALIEMELCREDRELAARFAMFNRLTAADRRTATDRPAAARTPPRTERPEPSRRLYWASTVVLLVALVVLGTIAATLAA